MCLWIPLCFVAASYACQSYHTDDDQIIPLGCVSGINGSTPWEPPRINTTFFVHDRNHLANPLRVLPWNASFDATDALFNPGDRLQFVIHGFKASSQGSWVQKLKNTFIRKDDRTKVLLVDWSDGALLSGSAEGTDPRLQGASNALMVGRVVACLIERIVSAYGIPETSVRIFGHSMGGQVMGRAAAWLSEKFDIRVGIGMASEATAHPFSIEGIYPEKKDVHFMVAIHTASSTPKFENNPGARGLFRAFADVDLYPNRGILVQPACRENNFELCSHEQANVFFMEMVANCDEHCDFQGFVCENEGDAVNGTCSNQNVQVCSLIRTLEEDLKDSDRESIILTFETNMENLRIECT